MTIFPITGYIHSCRHDSNNALKMEINFKGKCVAVTGAGSAIGRDIPILLSKSGGTTYGVSLLQSELDSLQAGCPDIIPIS